MKYIVYLKFLTVIVIFNKFSYVYTAPSWPEMFSIRFIQRRFQKANQRCTAVDKDYLLEGYIILDSHWDYLSAISISV